MCAAFGISPFPWLHFICLYSPHIMSPPSNLHWFLPCVLHLSNVPLSKLHLLFLFFFHLQFWLFPTCILLSHFSAIVMCASFRFAFSNSIFLALFHFSTFQDVNILEQAQFDITTVIKFQYVAGHSRHSFADVTKFHLHFHSLDVALPSSIGFQHQLLKINSACCSR